MDHSRVETASIRPLRAVGGRRRRGSGAVGAFETGTHLTASHRRRGPPGRGAGGSTRLMAHRSPATAPERAPRVLKYLNSIWIRKIKYFEYVTTRVDGRARGVKPGTGRSIAARFLLRRLRPVKRRRCRPLSCPPTGRAGRAWCRPPSRQHRPRRVDSDGRFDAIRRRFVPRAPESRRGPVSAADLGSFVSPRSVVRGGSARVAVEQIIFIE